MQGEETAITETAGYFDMGGYAAYVWPSYGIALLALAALVAWSVGRTRKLERKAARLRRENEQ